jgi:hypothetical protein
MLLLRTFFFQKMHSEMLKVSVKNHSFISTLDMETDFFCQCKKQNLDINNVGFS